MSAGSCVRALAKNSFLRKVRGTGPCLVGTLISIFLRSKRSWTNWVRSSSFTESISGTLFLIVSSSLFLISTLISNCCCSGDRTEKSNLLVTKREKTSASATSFVLRNNIYACHLRCSISCLSVFIFFLNSFLSVAGATVYCALKSLIWASIYSRSWWNEVSIVLMVLSLNW